MTPARWAAVAIGLVGAFLVSTAIGGFAARQLRPQPSSPSVAAVSQTPGHVSATPAASSGLGTARPSTPVASAASASPPETTQPTDQPTSALPATAAPTTAVPTTQVPTSIPTSIPTGGLDPPTAEDFANDLSEAIRNGDNAYMVARLHSATLERYGLRACRRHINEEISGSNVTWEIQGSSGPAPWDYVADNLTTSIPDAWTVSVRQAGATPELRDLHFAPVDGTWRWFTDCGDPL